MQFVEWMFCILIWISLKFVSKDNWKEVSIGLGKGFPDSKVHGADMGPTWSRQDPGGPHVGPVNFAIWVGAEQAGDKPMPDQWQTNVDQYIVTRPEWIKT